MLRREVEGSDSSARELPLELLRALLVTRDKRLARSSGHRARFEPVA